MRGNGARRLLLRGGGLGRRRRRLERVALHETIRIGRVPLLGGQVVLGERGDLLLRGDLVAVGIVDGVRRRELGLDFGVGPEVVGLALLP